MLATLFKLQSHGVLSCWHPPEKATLQPEGLLIRARGRDFRAGVSLGLTCLFRPCPLQTPECGTTTDALNARQRVRPGPRTSGAGRTCEEVVSPPGRQHRATKLVEFCDPK